MSIASIASGIFAIAKAIPVVQELIEQVHALYMDWKFSQYEETLDEKSEKRRALVKAIKKAETNEERLNLSKLLYDLDHAGG